MRNTNGWSGLDTIKTPLYASESTAPGKKSSSRLAALRTREEMILHNGESRATPENTPYTDFHGTA